MRTRRSVGAAAVLCLLAAVPLTAQVSGLNPVDNCPVWAASPLPSATPNQPYNIALGKNLGTVKLQSTDPARPALPAGLSITGGTTIQGTTTAAATGWYEFKAAFVSDIACPNVTMPGPGGNVYSRVFTLAVRDIEAPKLTAFTVDQPNVGAGGGNVVVSANTWDNMEIRRVMLTVRHPDGHQGSTPMAGPSGQRSGIWSLTIPVAANSGELPVSYYFTVTVDDGSGNAARGGPITTTVAAKTVQRLPVTR